MALLDGIHNVPSLRFRKGRGGRSPVMCVMHWSAGWGDAEEMANYFKAPTKLVKSGKKDEHGEDIMERVARLASYHFVIGRDGMVIQLVDTKNTAWHAGGGTDFAGLQRINERSIGICLANRGPLNKDPKWTAAHPDRVFEGSHTKPGFRGYGNRFETYTEAQLIALKNLLPRLIELHPTITGVLGHEDVVHGKGDPGPTFNQLQIDWSSLKLVRHVKDWATGKWHTLEMANA